MDTVYVYVKDLNQEEFNQYAAQLDLEEGQIPPEYHDNMVFAYGVDAEDYIIGGEEVNCWPVILDLEKEDVHDLQFDEENPPTITQEQVDNLEVYAYEDAEEDEINWYHSSSSEDDDEDESDGEEPAE